MRVIFLGTPELAVPTLETLVREPDFDVVGAVCQPDRPQGRGKKVKPPPVKQIACKHDVPVLQPEKLSKSKETVAQMKDMKPDVLVMVAFGQILKKEVLELASMGVVNLHGSLLPAYRGPAPINWAIINGDSVTGVTTMQTDAGVDTGDMLLKATIDIHEDMDAIELGKTLAETGAHLIVETLRGLEAGTITPEKQDDSLSSYAPLLSKDLGAVNWCRPASRIHDQVRGLVPWPGSFTEFRGKKLKLVRTRTADGCTSAFSLEPGTIVIERDSVMVACGETGEERLELIKVQPPNKPSMVARDWANGARIEADEKFQTLESVG